MVNFWRRLVALTTKEFKQLFRDISNLLLGIGLPIILILIFGYGISFDITSVDIGVVDEEHSQLSREITNKIKGTPYFNYHEFVNVSQAEQALVAKKVEAYISLDSNFSKNLQDGNISLGIITDGKDANRSQTVYAYLTQIVSSAISVTQDSVNQSNSLGSVSVESRMWFNPINNSTWYIIPGLIVLIVTLVGTFLTALVMAREWERGTLEAIFVSPVHPLEIILGKIIPYFCIGFLGLLICMSAGKLLFEVPLHGSLLLLYAFSMVYLIITLAIGLLVSSITRNQFIASQISVLLSFLPCLMFSDFIFDLRNGPDFVYYVGHLLPSTYYLAAIKTIYLAGDYYPLLMKNGLILLGYMFVLIGITVRNTKKTLD